MKVSFSEKKGNDDFGGVPSLLEPPQNSSQLSLRALFFLQIQAAVIMLFVTMAVSRQTSPVPLAVSTFFWITLFSCIVGTTLSIQFSTRWSMMVGPAVGASVGLIASALTLSPTSNFQRLMYASLVTSTLLILMSCLLGRSLLQEENTED